MRTPRWAAGGLALWFALTPGVALADETLAAYARGELSLGEYEAARRQDLPLPRATRAPAAPEEAAAAEEGTSPPGALGKLGAWIRDFPRRMTRRWKPEEQGFGTAEEASDHIENAPVPAYTANATQREADSDWKRPLLVTARGEADTIQTVIERVVGFGGLAALSKALAGDAAAQEAVKKAGQVVQRLTPEQRRTLTATLHKGPLKQQLAQFLGGKPTSRMGKLVKDQFGNNMILAVAASGLVHYLLNDGLDLDTLKDHLVALNALEERRTWREDLVGVPAETVALYHLVNASGKVYEKIWNKVATGPGGLAAWVRRTETTLSTLGNRIVQRPPAHLAQKAAELGKSAQALGLPGVSAATALSFKGLLEAGFSGVTIGMIGIPLINGGWKVVMGLPEGMYVGGDRDRFFARYDLPHSYFQRTGDPLKDAVEERVVATKNFIEWHEKFPATNFMNYFLRVTGGYIGAVVASALVAPVGIPSFAAALVSSAIFSEGGRALGQWAGSKIDTRPGAYRKRRERNAGRIFEASLEQGVDVPERREALATLAALDRARVRAGVRTASDLKRVMAGGEPGAAELARLGEAYVAARERYRTRVAALAVERAHDFEALMKVASTERNIRYVASFDQLLLERRDDGYIWVVTPDGWEAHASPRFDFVDARGHRGVWDPETNRVLDVGRVADQNGNRIAFLDDAGVVLRDGVIEAPEEPEGSEGNVVVTKNGVVLERTTRPATEEDREAAAKARKKRKKGKAPTLDADGRVVEWLVRGYGGEFDIVLRTSGRRFAWDGERFREVTPGAAPLAEAAEAPEEDSAPVSAKEARKQAKAEAEAKAEEAKDRAFDRELEGELAGGSPGKGAPVGQAMRDLARFHRTRGSSEGLRYSRALAAGD